MNMVKKFLNLIKDQARKAPARIVFSEIFDERVEQAVKKITKEKKAIPVLIE